MTIHTTTEKIILQFGWQGPSHEDANNTLVQRINLSIKNAKATIDIDIPKDFSPSAIQKLPFTYRKPSDKSLNDPNFRSETHPPSLMLSIEQIHNLTITAIFCNKIDNTISDEKKVELKMPKKLENGQTYILAVTSDHLALLARFFKETPVNPKDTKQSSEDRMQREMSRALVTDPTPSPLPPTGDAQEELLRIIRSFICHLQEDSE